MFRTIQDTENSLQQNTKSAGKTEYQVKEVDIFLKVTLIISDPETTVVAHVEIRVLTTQNAKNE